MNGIWHSQNSKEKYSRTDLFFAPLLKPQTSQHEYVVNFMIVICSGLDILVLCKNLKLGISILLLSEIIIVTRENKP